jgi:hypothetical protein
VVGCTVALAAEADDTEACTDTSGCAEAETGTACVQPENKIGTRQRIAITAYKYFFIKSSPPNIKPFFIFNSLP